MKISLMLLVFFGTRMLAQSLPPKCADFPDNWFVKNPNNCRAYWHCENVSVTPRLHYCPENLYFDEATQACTTSNQYACTNDTPHMSNRTSPSERCRDLSDGHFISNANGCRSFFVCLGGIAFPGQCEMGFNFNEDLQICDTPTGTPCENENFECPMRGISRWELPGSCTTYNFCFGGQHSVEECAPGLHFDSAISLCQHTDIVECTRDRCPLINDVENRVTFPSETSCEEYYVCFDGIPKMQRCAPGIHWNQETRRCETPEDANCELPTETTTSSITTSHPPFDIICPPEDADLHLFPHPFNCQNFFVCSAEVAHEERCADGLLFDSILLRCDFPDQARCSDGSSRIPKIRSNFLSNIIKILK